MELDANIQKILFGLGDRLVVRVLAGKPEIRVQITSTYIKIN